MAVSHLSDLIAALQRGDDAAIVGTPESDWLDFKRTAYLPFDDEHKLELAKDVTALANNRGGILVLGFATRKDTQTTQDIADALTRIRRDTANVEQYRASIEALTYPPLRNPAFRWWLPDGDDGVLTIEVPVAADTERPVMVVKVREQGQRKEVLLGVFERAGDMAARLQPAQLHAQLQLGRLLQTAGIGALAPAKDEPASTDARRNERREADLRDVGLVGKPHLWLQAWPTSKGEVRGLHSTEPGSPRYQLARPESLRPAGFNLKNGSNPLILPGGTVRTAVEDRMSLSIERDGLLTWLVSAGPEFLAWAGAQRGHATGLNSRALVESTYEFMRFFVNVVLTHLVPPAQDWYAAGGLAGMQSTEPPVLLHPGPPSEYPFMGWQRAHTNTTQFGPIHAAGRGPAEMAYAVLKEVYFAFSLDPSAIPFADGERVDEAQLLTS